MPLSKSPALSSCAALLWLWLTLALGFTPACPAAERQTIQVPPAAGSAGINKALAALKESGGEVVLSAGTYVIQSPVIIHSDRITLRGAGPSTLLRLAAKANCPVVVIGDEANQPRHTVRGVCVADLRIDGNRTQQQGECWNGVCDTGPSTAIRSSGVVIRRARDILVLRVSASRCRSGGMVTEKVCRRLVVQDFSASENEFDGLACYETEDSTFAGLDLHHNKSAGISTDIHFDHNTFSNVRMFHNGSHGIFMRNSSDNRFENIEVRHSGRAGIFVDQVDEGRNTGSVGNRFNKIRVIASGGPGFQVNAVSCKRTQLTHSVLEDNASGVWEAAPKLVVQEDVVVRSRVRDRGKAKGESGSEGGSSGGGENTPLKVRLE
ncbi:right-handed parallel beta-helix repeat-containing protein [Prosthecobacter sp.]|uniref:right-handed parallel beta-helix repeat-containing protein n=1 Tax=Prosthecobacter sp. TaxID=1965333 RepID=UPI0037848F14